MSKRCNCSGPVDQASHTCSQTKCCPPPKNIDPRRNIPYIPPNPSRSEPLSHAEYLRRLKANNGCAISSPKNMLQVGADTLQGSNQKYIRTIWTESKQSDGCVEDKVIPAVPAVHPGGHALDASMQTMMNGAAAARGTVSEYDQINRTEWSTTYRRQGLAIIQDDEYKAPAGSTEGREICTDCTLEGTTEIIPGEHKNCC